MGYSYSLLVDTYTRVTILKKFLTFDHLIRFQIEAFSSLPAFITSHHSPNRGIGSNGAMPLRHCLTVLIDKKQ